MSLELPGWVADAFNLTGLPWPGIDEDQLRVWASDLRAYSAEITALAGRSSSAVAAVAAPDESAFARALASQWDHYRGVISGLRGPLEVFAGAVDVAADAVVAQKIVVIGAAVALAGEVIATQGEALFTFGLAEAEVPAEVAATQLIVRAALQELEGQLLGVLISKAAAVVSDALGGAVGKLVAGGGQVAAEVVVLKADYSAMRTVTTALTGHRSRVEQASSVSWRRATSRELETGGFACPDRGVGNRASTPPLSASVVHPTYNLPAGTDCTSWSDGRGGRAAGLGKGAARSIAGGPGWQVSCRSAG